MLLVRILNPNTTKESLYCRFHVGSDQHADKV